MELALWLQRALLTTKLVSENSSSKKTIKFHSFVTSHGNSSATEPNQILLDFESQILSIAISFMEFQFLEIIPVLLFQDCLRQHGSKVPYIWICTRYNLRLLQVFLYTTWICCTYDICGKGKISVKSPRTMNSYSQLFIKNQCIKRALWN